MTPPLGSPQKKGKSIPIALGVGLTALVVLLFFLRPGLFEGVHSKLYDLSLQARGSLSAPQEVVIVAIDDASVASLGRWPWPRGKMAELIALLSRAGRGLSPCRRGEGFRKRPSPG
jgi:adenylate cyclase